ncbi:serine/threonine protein kinase [Bradymonadaceae bacterium TMQ3]|nr:serine/threonine protein kinase [Bradymonadaceae bacterium TMQ3]TXC78041.1 serine/threonine protein kinase [Bradymonadales bacterium TMQ1]
MSPVSMPETIAERYELIETLGHGGMATVFRAFDRTLARQVAIKRLHPHLASIPEHRARFEREARAVARLDHPGIVKIYDFSSPESDDAYIVMELVDGESLAALLERCGPLPPEFAAIVIAETLQALDLAHQHQIIHRDLKPENIMLRADTSVVILDFGLANLLDQARITRSGALLGSPAFMAPELMEGHSADIKSDLFAIGATFYRLVTGDDAFEGNHPAQILRAIERGDHTPAHRRQPRVGRRFSQLISRWMSVAPEKRPASAIAAQNELQALVDVTLWRQHLKQYINKSSCNSLEIDATHALDALICNGLMQRVETLSSQDDTLAATYELERVLAYQPDSPEALTKLSFLNARARRPLRPGLRALTGAAALLVLAVTGGVLWLDERASAAEGVTFSAGLREPPPRLAETRPHSQTPPSTAPRYSVDVGPLGAHVAVALDVARDAASSSSARPAPAASIARRPGAEPAVATTLAASELEQAPDASASTAPQTLKQRFRVIPAAATLSIDGKRYSAIEAARGIELPVGPTLIEATSPGCEALRTSIDITRESSQRAQRVVLSWLPGYIELVTDRNALVWLDQHSRPVMVSAGGASEPLEVPFGRADEAPARRQVELRVASHHDLTRILSRTVTVRPGQTTSLALSLGDTDPRR